MKTLSPLRLCDECKFPINKVEEGWVEWLEDDSTVKDVRIIHNSKYSVIGECSKHKFHPQQKSSHLEFVLNDIKLKNKLKIA